MIKNPITFIIYLSIGLALLGIEAVWAIGKFYLEIKTPTMHLRASLVLMEYVFLPINEKKIYLQQAQKDSIYIWPLNGVEFDLIVTKQLALLLEAVETTYPQEYRSLASEEKKILLTYTLPSLADDIIKRQEAYLYADLEEISILLKQSEQQRLEWIIRHVGFTRYRWEGLDKSLYYLLVHDQGKEQWTIYLVSISDIAVKLSFLRKMWLPGVLFLVISFLLIVQSIAYQWRQNYLYTENLEQRVKERTMQLELEIVANVHAYEEIEQLKKKLELENVYLREEISTVQAFGDIIGQSDGLMKLLQQIDQVAPTNTSVLVLGESGTGKELIAREIHKRSRRRNQPMINVNCASIPKELYESEFFGHVKGAFTGATKDRPGRFQAADGGTLFLDEIGEIPLELQSKLLRVLQEGEYDRLGEEVTRKVDVRIITATSRDMKKEIEKGRFRQDLYYRLNVFPVEISPLRHRKEDIPLLVTHAINQIARKLNRPVPKITQGTILNLQNYDWPGNVRELQNLIERAMILSTSKILRIDLPQNPMTKSSNVSADLSGGEIESAVVTDREMKRRERLNILKALKQSHWKIFGSGGAAEILEIKPTTLSSRVKKMGITH